MSFSKITFHPCNEDPITPATIQGNAYRVYGRIYVCIGVHYAYNSSSTLGTYYCMENAKTGKRYNVSYQDFQEGLQDDLVEEVDPLTFLAICGDDEQ